MSALTMALVLQYAARPHGVGHGEVTEMSTKEYGRAVCALKKRKQLWTCNISHKVARYFASAEACDAFGQRVLNRHLGGQRSSMPGVTIYTPRYVGFRRDAEVITPSHIKVIQCPSPPPRFQALGLTLPIQRGRVLQGTP